MTTFVRAAKHATDDPKDHRVHVTGDVLHLAVWAPDRPGTALLFGTGWWTPLCGGGGRHVEKWKITGPWAERWGGHAHWPVCRRCQHVLDELAAAAAVQTRAHQQHAAAVAA